uniref:Cupin 2 domain-containing protein n=1 Tax=Candidatus Kentrum sp. DK TaxID=2126562 RepID=A0A450SQ37_9GAMM|nr:MAG: cupin 2 domain-containing protein [Candidatus Kentron sp. DK]
MKKNIFDAIPNTLEKEIFEDLAGNKHIKIERIISRGHRSPESGWHDQEQNEWVMVLRGEAVVSFPDGSRVHLRTGDFIDIPRHRKHRVDWTTPEKETIWLAVHYWDA